MSIRRREFLGAVAALGLAGRARADEKAAKPRKILFLGGTGFLGPQTVEVALKRGHEVTLFNRGKTRPGLFPDVEKLHGDRDKDDLKELGGSRAWDAVIDTSANVPRWVRKATEALKGRVGHYIYISSVSVYADMSRPGTDEGGKVQTIEDVETEKIDGRTYGALKALCEQAAEKAMPGKTTVVRPGLIVGPDDPSDRFTYWPVRVAKGGEVLAPGTPDDPVQLIDARDLGAWLVKLVEDETTGVFNALGPAPAAAPPLTIGRVLDACKAASGSDARFTWVEEAFLEAQKVAPWSDMPVWIPPSGDSVGFHRVENARAVKAGLTFRPIEQTARDTLAWFRSQPEARQNRLRSGIKPEREAEVLAAWKAKE